MYEIMGNVIALQYGGSEAHGKFFERMRGRSEAATKSKELLTSLRRYYSNAVSDPEKQDAINLFLGNFIPCQDGPALWELGSDYFMHCGVDWEMNKTNFGAGASPATTTLPSRASIALSSSDNASSSLLRRSSTRSLSSIQVFPVPVISQTGDPESIKNPEQSNKKEGSGPSNWSLKFWFGSGSGSSGRSTKNLDFKLPPESKGPSLESFEEMLKINPVIEVRLYDGHKTRNKGTTQNLDLQQKLAKLQKQDNSTTELTSHIDAEGLFSRYSFDLQTQSSQFTNQIETTGQLTGQMTGQLTVKKQGIPKSSSCQSRIPVGAELISEFQDHTYFENDEFPVLPRRPQMAPKLQSKSVSIERTTPKWSWFGGLSRASSGSHKKKPSAARRPPAHRAASTPADVGLIGRTKDKSENPEFLNSTTKGLDLCEEFWDEYWSITEHTLASELTLAERISNSTDKTIKTRRQMRQTQSNVIRGTENVRNNVFLDELISQFLDKNLDCSSKKSDVTDHWTDRVLGIPRHPPLCKGEEIDGKEGTQGGLKSNINALLFASSSGPGDRILEKWFLADRKAEADYQRNLSWIVSPVN